MGLDAWLVAARERLPARELPITSEVLLAAARLEVPGADEIDRLLVATALIAGGELATLDGRLLAAAQVPAWRPPAAAEPAVARPAVASVPAPSEHPAPAVEPPAAVSPPAAAPEPPATPEPAATTASAARETAPATTAPAEPPPRLRALPSIRAIPQHPVETTDSSFAGLGLSEPILRALARIGFTHPTPIQAAVIPPALAGRDVIGLAQTGSGKTAAFCLPLAEKLTHGRGVRGLILSPTREIALQTQGFLDLFGDDHKLKTVCLIGGVSMGPQLDGLRAKPDVVVATPGRLLDHLRRRTLSLAEVSELVFDEADHMLDLGFLPQIQDVLRYLPARRHTMMFSATMPEAIERLARQLLHEPVRVDILPEGRTAEGISHRLYLVDPDEKKACLLALLHQELGSTLVFIRRKVDAEWLTGVLSKEGHPVDRIHSDLSQGQRVEALAGFREGEHRILVATDIAARGIDIPRIQHIINFDLPESVEDYVHRAGRTARGRLKGTVSSIASWQDKMMIREIEMSLGHDLPRCTVPGVQPWDEWKVRPKGRHRLPSRRRL